MKRAAEVLNVPLHEVDELPLIWKLKALAYTQVMDKTRPALEEAAAAKARQKQNNKPQTMGQRMGKGAAKPVAQARDKIAATRRR